MEKKPIKRKRVFVTENKIKTFGIEFDVRLVDGKYYDYEGNLIIPHGNTIFKCDYFNKVATMYITNTDCELYTIYFKLKKIDKVLEHKYTISYSNVNSLEFAIVTTDGGTRLERILFPNKVIKNLEYYYGNELDLCDFYE